MPKKIGEIAIDLTLGRGKFDRDLDDATRSATEAGRKMEEGANRATRSYAGLNAQVSSLAQQLAGLAGVSRIPGAGALAGLGGAAGAGGLAGLAALAGAYTQERAEAGDRIALKNSLADNAAARAEAIASVQQTALLPSEQRLAAIRLSQARFTRRNAQDVIALGDRLSDPGSIGSLRQGLATGLRALNEGLFRRTDISRLLPGPYSVTGSIFRPAIDAIGLDDDIARAQAASTREAQAYAVDNRRLIEESNAAAAITSSPAFQAASRIDELRTMSQGIERMVQLMEQMAAQAGATPPGGAVQ